MQITTPEPTDTPDVLDEPAAVDDSSTRLADETNHELRPRRLRLPQRASALVLVMSVYPVVFMGGILRPTSPYHLRNRWADPDLLTDFDGGIRLAQVIESMRWPWSASPLSAVPTGESILRWQTMSQGIQFGAMYLLTRVLEPTFTLNLIVLIGWVLTGCAVYGLARRLGAALPTAIAAGIVTQMLPSMPTMAANYTSYVYIGVPVFVVSRTLDMCCDPSRRNLGWLVAAVAIALFFDPYWYFFSLVIVLIGVLANARTMVEWFRSSGRWLQSVVSVMAIAPMLLIAAVVVLDRAVSEASTSRPLGVAHAGLVHAGLRSPWHWFRSSFEGVGLVVGCLGFVALALTLWRREDARRTTAGVITLVFVLLSTRTRIDASLFTIGSLAEYARFGLPGVRFFQRAALVAEALLVIGAAMLVQTVVLKIDRVAVRATITVGLLVLLVADLDPPGHRAYQRRWDDFTAFREIVSETDAPVVAAVPFERSGRSWFELAMLGPVKSINPLYASDRAFTTAHAASRGPASLAAYFDSLDVTHLLAVRGREGYPVSYEFEAPRFVRRGTIMVHGYEAGPQVVDLFEVSAQPGDSYCPDCSLGGDFDVFDGAIAEGDVDVPETGGRNGPRWWWVTGEEFELTVELLDLGFEYDVGVELTFGNALCEFPRTITVTHGSTSQDLRLEGTDNPNVVVPVTFAREPEPIRVSVDGRVCRVSSDPRDLMIQVFEPRLIDVEGESTTSP